MAATDTNNTDLARARVVGRSQARRMGLPRYPPGLCKAETIAGIAKHGFVLTPGRYVGAEEQDDDGEPFTEKYPRLLTELEACFGEGERLMAVVHEKLKAVGDAG